MASNGQTNWDKEVDVIVVGYGAAGGMSPTMPRWSGCVLINRYSDSANSASLR